MSDLDDPFTPDPSPPAPEPEIMTKPKPTSETPSAAPVYLDSSLTAGWTCAGPSGTFLVRPGLNIVDSQVWTSVFASPPIKAALEAGWLKVIREDLSGAAENLIGRSVDSLALVTVLNREDVKPVTAGPSKRRNKALCDELARRITVLARFAVKQSA
jgi:hypothetical protein